MALFIQGSKVLCNGAVSFAANCWCWHGRRGRAARRGFGYKLVLEPGVKMLELNFGG